jgi:META domain
MKILSIILIFVIFSCKNVIEEECSCIAPITLQGRWNFIGFVKADGIIITETKVQHPFNSFIQFDNTDGQKMSGRMAINLISGNYTFLDRTNDFRGNDLQFQQLGGTKIAVTQEQGIFEQQFFNQMNLVTSYEITKEGVLLLYDRRPNTNETMIFRK